MRLYIPLILDEEVEICCNFFTQKLISEDSCIELPASLPANAVFSIKANGITLFNSSTYQLREAERTIRLLCGETCLDIKKNNSEALSPINPTRIFYTNDAQIVVFVELAGVRHDTPVVVSWLYQEELFFGTVATIPASVDGEFNNYHSTYANGIFLTPDLPKGSLNVNVSLLSGKEIYSASVELLDRNRPEYGGTTNELSYIKKGGLLNELVE